MSWRPLNSGRIDRDGEEGERADREVRRSRLSEKRGRGGEFTVLQITVLEHA